MGVLQSTDGTQTDLPPRALIGRSPSCDLTLDDASISGEHAVLAWRIDRWEIRDLGSRNGTRVDGQALSPGVSVGLARGARIELGVGGVALSMVEDAPPVPRAVALSDGQVVLAEGDFLALPDSESPELVVVRTGSRWILEGESGAQPVNDRHRLQLAGRSWELRLPHLLPSTRAAPLALDAVSLKFQVSLDEEHVVWFVDTPTGWVELGDRVHTYLLLTLARARLEDTELPEDSRGWRYADELSRRLGITPENLKVYVYRARKQLQGAGVSGATGLVERRAASNQIRLGVDSLHIERA